MGSADVCVLCQILLQHQQDTFSRIGYYCITIDHSARKGRKVIIMASFLDFFQISVGALTREKRDLVDIDASTTVHDAIAIFNEQRVSTLPVYETSKGSDPAYCHNGRSYVGMISMADITVYIITFAKSFIVCEGDGKSVTQCLNDPIRETIGSANESDVFIGFSTEHEDSPLSRVVERMCIGINIYNCRHISL
jgi:hypothetical protein